MRSNEYSFVTCWRVQGTPEEVFRVLEDPLDLVRWWPAVYLDVKEVQPGDAEGLGRVVRLHTRGWLPYTLRWYLRGVERTFPSRVVIEAEGDFVGRGVWTFAADGDWVNATYDWRIRADKPMLRWLSF